MPLRLIVVNKTRSGSIIDFDEAVEAAGALMDYEVTNLAQVKAFDSSDYATAAQGSTADSAMQDLVDDTTPQLGGDLDGQGNYAVDLQNFPDMLSGGPGYWFDGVDDAITVADNPNIDFGSGDFSIINRFRYKTISDTGHLLSKGGGGGQGYATYISFSTGYLTFDIKDNSTRVKCSITNELTDNKVYTISNIIDRSAGTVESFVGSDLKNTTDISGITGSIDTSQDLYFGRLSSSSINYLPYELFENLFFNLALTEAEVKAFSNGAAIPYKYLGASQTNYFDNIVLGGTAVDNGGGNYTLVADGTSDINKISDVDMWVANTKDAKEIRVKYTIVSNSFVGNTSLYSGYNSGDEIFLQKELVSTVGTHEIVQTPERTGSNNRLYFVTKSTSTSGIIVIENISVTQVGCTLDLNQSGITETQWLDASGNSLHGTVDGPVVTNRPIQQIVQQNLLTNSGFETWSNSTLENVGDQVTVSDVTSGVCTSADTKDLTVGKLFRFNSGDFDTEVYEITALTADTSFTLNDLTLTDSGTPGTGYEVTPACIASNNLGPDGWGKDITLAVYREHNGSNTKDGSFYAIKATAGAANDFLLAFYSFRQNLEHYMRFRGKTITMGCWVKTDTPSHVRLRIFDGAATYSEYHTGGDDWEWIELSRMISTSATDVSAGLFFDTNGATAYISQPILIFGSHIGTGNYSKPPGEWIYCENRTELNSFNGASFSTVGGASLINLESESNGIIGKGAKAVLLHVLVNDSDSSGTLTFIQFRGLDYGDAYVTVYPSDVSDRFGSNQIIVPCDSNGDIYYNLTASGVGTFDCKIYLSGVQVR